MARRATLERIAGPWDELPRSEAEPRNDSDVTITGSVIGGTSHNTQVGDLFLVPACMKFNGGMGVPRNTRAQPGPGTPAHPLGGISDRFKWVGLPPDLVGARGLEPPTSAV